MLEFRSVGFLRWEENRRTRRKTLQNTKRHIRDSNSGHTSTGGRRVLHNCAISASPVKFVNDSVFIFLIFIFSFIDPFNFTFKANSHISNVEIDTRQNYAILTAQLRKGSYFLKKCCVPATGLECSYRKIFFPVADISVVETEISVTGLARFLIRAHRKFYKENRSEPRSR